MSAMKRPILDAEEAALRVAYRAVLQANMLAGPHSLISGDCARLQRILEITDHALQTLNSEFTEKVRREVFGI